MRLLKFLNENKEDKHIAKYIYDVLSTKGKECKEGSVFQCHISIQWIKRNEEFQKYWWYNNLTFIEWNEWEWKNTAERLKKDNAIKKFSNKHVKNLIEDISDFTVNGHSLLKYNEYYIDPYLKSLGVSNRSIQKFGKYWERIVRG